LNKIAKHDMVKKKNSPILMAFRPERCAPIGRSSRIAPRAELSFCSVPTQPHGYDSMLDEAGGEEVVVNAVW
jgi:hypothetical protein